MIRRDSRSSTPRNTLYITFCGRRCAAQVIPADAAITRSATPSEFV
jgi:hypothetical protein